MSSLVIVITRFRPMFFNIFSKTQKNNKNHKNYIFNMFRPITCYFVILDPYTLFYLQIF